MDCENCRHLTVVGLHDTGPWIRGVKATVATHGIPPTQALQIENFFFTRRPKCTYTVHLATSSWLVPPTSGDQKVARSTSEVVSTFFRNGGVIFSWSASTANSARATWGLSGHLVLRRLAVCVTHSLPQIRRRIL